MAFIELRHPQDQKPGSLSAIHPMSVYPLRKGFRRQSDKIDKSDGASPWTLAGKRVFDVVASSALLFMLAPLFVVLMAWIPLDSPGGPFFVHPRIGLHGRTFQIIKFRTMRTDAHAHREELVQVKESERLLFKHKQDPRVTRLGRLLRKYSVDELPQILNVLRGDMSLIGPRPLLKEDFSRQTLSKPLALRWLRERHRLWPGITGLWQVSGRSELSFEESMRLDIRYVTEWNWRLDLYILLMTLPAVLQGRGAY